MSSLADYQIIEKPGEQWRSTLYASMGCMTNIAGYLTYHELLRLQACGRKLYREIVPRVMMNQSLLPQVGLYHFLRGAEYDPEVIRAAARKDSGKFFVPN